MLYLTVDQHRQVLQRLTDLARGRLETGRLPLPRAELEFTSLMLCFLFHNLSAAETLLRISSSFGGDWFPVTVGYAIARTMFEADVTAHFIAQAPDERARQYIDFAKVLNKKCMDACREHRNSKDPQWREAMDLVWKHRWADRENDILKEFDAVAPGFTRTNRSGARTVFQNWAGKTLRQMAAEVEHLEAYDISYGELSSFAHVDVHLADRFLKLRADGPLWSMRAEEGDVGNVFRHAAAFLDCYLTMFGKQFKTWAEADVQDCWLLKPDEGQKANSTVS